MPGHDECMVFYGWLTVTDNCMYTYNYLSDELG
jgi:hypothetical protein